MALKDFWIDLIDGESEIVVDNINDIAQAVIEIEEKGAGGGNIVVDDVMSDTSENPVQNKVAKSYVDGLIGDIDAALDGIIAIQNELLGVSE